MSIIEKNKTKQQKLFKIRDTYKKTTLKKVCTYIANICIMQRYKHSKNTSEVVLFA